MILILKKYLRRSIFNPLFAIDLCRFIISPRKGLPRLLYLLLTAKADS